MTRFLANLRFWALALSLIWIVAVTVLIAQNPGFAAGH